MTALKFDVSCFSSSVNEAPSDFSGSGDAHCSADAICFAISHLLDWSNEVFLVIGDVHSGSQTPDCVASVSLILKTMGACLWMLKNHFCPIFVFGGLFAVSSKVHAFEMAHFWINVSGAHDIVAELASRFEFKLCKIRRKLTIRVVTVFTGSDDQ